MKKRASILILAIIIILVCALIFLKFPLTGKAMGTAYAIPIAQLPTEIAKAKQAAPIGSTTITLGAATSEITLAEEILTTPYYECKDVIICQNIPETETLSSGGATSLYAIAPLFQTATDPATLRKQAVSELYSEISPLQFQQKTAEVEYLKIIPCLVTCIYPAGFSDATAYDITMVADVMYDIPSKEFLNPSNPLTAYAIQSEAVDTEALDFLSVQDVLKRKVDNESIDGRGIKVAIIDSGIDYTHPDLGGCIGKECKVIEGWNALENNADVIDKDGHGTHLAGIVASVAPNASLIAVKTCQDNKCSSSNIAKGIDWCLQHGCNVATLSLGDGKSYDEEECKRIATLKTVLETASADGLALFVSSGNDGLTWPAYPACNPYVTSVGSVNDYDGKISDFSNLHPDVFAPGAVIKSTWPNGEYRSMVGTSQAAAFAAAVSALYMQTYNAVNKRMPTPLLIEEQFETFSDLVRDTTTGKNYPTLNAKVLVESIIGAEPLSSVCGNIQCEFWLGEDSQNCPADCKAPLQSVCGNTLCETGETMENCPEDCKEEIKNYPLSLSIKDWGNADTSTRVEVRNSIVKGFSYPDIRSIDIPEGAYDIKLAYGEFSLILRSVNLTAPLSIDMHLANLDQKIRKITALGDTQVKAVYALGTDMSVIICFDKKLAGNNTFVYRCAWDGQKGACKDGWKPFMSMKPEETSCILTVPGNGTAFAVVEMPEAVCGDDICEPEETVESCPEDCKEGITPSGKIVKPMIDVRFVIIGAVALLIIIFIVVALKRGRHARVIRAIKEELPEAPRS